MPANLTEKEFSRHIGTKFHVRLDDLDLELELIEVKGYFSQEIEQDGLERFSVFFVGPRDPFLPQRIYQIEHKHLGEFELFLVPIAGDEKTYRYEAVFNYFKAAASKKQ